MYFWSIRSDLLTVFIEIFIQPNAERTQIIKPPSTNKSNVEVQRTLEMNIFEMIAKRRPGISEYFYEFTPKKPDFVF